MAGARLGSDTRWIEVSPAYFDALQRRATRAMIPLLVILAFMFGVIWFTVGDTVASHPRILWKLVPAGVVMGLSVFVLPLSGRLARRALEGFRLGASADALHYELGKRQASVGGSRSDHVSWRDVYYDGKRILAARKILVVANARGDPMFEPADMERTILAHIPRANRVTPTRLAMLSFAAYGPFAWLALFAGLACMALYAVWRLGYL